MYFQSGLYKATYMQGVCQCVRPRASCLKSSLRERKHSAGRIAQWEFLLYLGGKSEQTEF